MLGIDKNTLRYFVQSQPWGRRPGERGRKPGGANLTPYLPYIHKRWKAGCRNGMQLWREMRGKGYTGSASSVRPYLALLRQVPVMRCVNCARLPTVLSGIAPPWRLPCVGKRVMGKPRDRLPGSNLSSDPCMVEAVLPCSANAFYTPRKDHEMC